MLLHFQSPEDALIHIPLLFMSYANSVFLTMPTAANLQLQISKILSCKVLMEPHAT